MVVVGSSATLEVRDNVGAILGVGQPCECHGVTWGKARRGLEPLVEVAIRPLDGGLGL